MLNDFLEFADESQDLSDSATLIYNTIAVALSNGDRISKVQNFEYCTKETKDYQQGDSMTVYCNLPVSAKYLFIFYNGDKTPQQPSVISVCNLKVAAAESQAFS